MFYSKLLNMKIALMHQSNLRKNFFISGKEEFLNLHLDYSSELKNYINIIAKYPLSKDDKTIFDKLVYLKFKDDKYFDYIIENFHKLNNDQMCIAIDNIIKNHDEIIALSNVILVNFENTVEKQFKNINYQSLAAILSLIIPIIVFITIGGSFLFHYNSIKDVKLLSSEFSRSIKEQKNYLISINVNENIKELAKDLSQLLERFYTLQKNLNDSRKGNFNLIDEIKKLNSNYKKEILNYSEELKKAHKKLSNAERLASLGQLAAGVAHEIRNPLAGIQGAVNIIGKKFVPHDSKEIIDNIIHEIDRLDHIVQSLLDFSSPIKLFLNEISVIDIIQKTVFLIDTMLEDKNIKLNINGDESILLLADKDKMIQVMINILKNAVEVSEKNSEIDITFGCIQEKYKPEQIFIKIQDHGSGLDKKELEYIFNPFYTSKPQGTGLGLSIVYNIIKEHQGTITAESEKGKGTCFTIHIPNHQKG